MTVYGIDVTSRPGRGKPLTCAVARFRDDALVVERVDAWTDFDGLEALLASPGPWITAIDAPLGLPSALTEALGWDGGWRERVEASTALDRDAFRHALIAFRADRAAGDKEPKRPTDRAARSVSAMHIGQPPVGLMYYEIAPRLLRGPASVLPCRPRPGEDRIVVEAYPALVARRVLGRASYKGGSSADRPDRRARARRRCRLRRALAGAAGLGHHGFRVTVPDRALARSLVAEAEADRLDAVLCALQAGWAWRRRREGHGIPPGVDPAEGWIVDPATLAAAATVLPAAPGVAAAPSS